MSVLRIQRAVINDQEITFGIVKMPAYLLNSSKESEEFKENYHSIYRNIPIVFQSEVHGMLKYFGRNDLITYLKTA